MARQQPGRYVSCAHPGNEAAPAVTRDAYFADLRVLRHRRFYFLECVVGFAGRLVSESFPYIRHRVPSFNAGTSPVNQGRAIATYPSAA